MWWMLLLGCGPKGGIEATAGPRCLAPDLRVVLDASRISSRVTDLAPLEGGVAAILDGGPEAGAQAVFLADDGALLARISLHHGASATTTSLGDALLADVDEHGDLWLRQCPPTGRCAPAQVVASLGMAMGGPTSTQIALAGKTVWVHVPDVGFVRVEGGAGVLDSPPEDPNVRQLLSRGDGVVARTPEADWYGPGWQQRTDLRDFELLVEERGALAYALDAQTASVASVTADGSTTRLGDVPAALAAWLDPRRFARAAGSRGRIAVLTSPGDDGPEILDVRLSDDRWFRAYACGASVWGVAWSDDGTLYAYGREPRPVLLAWHPETLAAALGK